MGSEAPDVRLSGMHEHSTSRRRSTEALREADRLSQVVAIYLGRTVKAGRNRLRVDQKQLAARIGASQAWISRIELGRGHHVPLHTWAALGVALNQPLAISFSRPLGLPREPVDAGHLAMQERLLELARAAGRTGTFELPTRPADPRGSIDVCVRDANQRVLIIHEAWNTFGDIGAAVRSTNRKTAEAADLAAVDDGPPYRIATVWVVRTTAANRALPSRYPEIFRTTFPGSSRTWASAISSGTEPPPEPGLVWLDPTNGRITEWRKPAHSGASTRS